MNEDIYSYILKFLPVKDILTCITLNKSFYKISKSEILWKSITAKDFGNNIFRINYYETYKLCYLLNGVRNDIKYKGTYEEMYNSKKVIINTQLNYLPINIIHLHNLTKLDLSNNNLKIFPHEILQLSNLKFLNVTYNHLTTIPSEICKLNKLKKLYLSSNRITILPLEICQLINLTEFYISYNRLMEFPLQICKLINLKGLSLSGNNFKYLPSEICQLINLRTLYLIYNTLTIPHQLKKIPNLRIIT